MKTAPLTTATRPAITSTVGALSDRELLRETSNLVRHERHLQGAVIDHLAEIEARGLYLQRGFSSLFDYAVRELATATQPPLGASAPHGCAPINRAREGLRDGSLTLSAAAEQWAFDRSRRGSGTAAIAPAGSAGSDFAPAVPLLVLAAGRQKLVEEAAGKSAAGPPDAGRPGPGAGAAGRPGASARRRRYELKATIDAECRQGLEQLRGLLSHVDPRMTMGQLVGRLVREGLDRHDPSRPPRRARSGSRPADAKANAPRTPTPEQAHGRSAPAAKRRASGGHRGGAEDFDAGAAGCGATRRFGEGRGDPRRRRSHTGAGGSADTDQATGAATGGENSQANWQVTEVKVGEKERPTASRASVPVTTLMKSGACGHGNGKSARQVRQMLADLDPEIFGSPCRPGPQRKGKEPGDAIR